MIELTKIEGVPEKAAAVPGMAHFAGSGPPGKTCKDCKHRGYRRRSLKEHWDAVTGEAFDKFYRWAGCAMYRKLTGRHGKPIEGDNRSCKYFEELTKA
jgi:hypothetical protein